MTSLLSGIRKVIKKRDCKKPSQVTNPNMPDNFVEKDLQGFDLNEIDDKETKRLLSSDLATFNDEAFRYYLLQFIEEFYINNEVVFFVMFIQSFFESSILSKNSKRYLQFSKKEIRMILYFLHYPFEESDFSEEIKQAILFWEQHPNLNN